MLPLPDGFPKPPKLEMAGEACAKGFELGGAVNRLELPNGDTGAALVEEGVNLKPEEESFLVRLLNAEEAELSEVPKVKGVAVVLVVVVVVGVAVDFPVSGSDEDAGAVKGNLNSEGVAFAVAGIVGVKPPPLLVSPSLKADEPNVLFPKENELGGAGIAGGCLHWLDSDLLVSTFFDLS